MNVEAKYYEKLENKKVQCMLCHHNCTISPEKSGVCLIRKNIGGKLYQTSYNEVTSLNIDPIEKKPLYHFHPGSNILSLGTNGCNLKCSFCQNWQISTQITGREEITTEQLVQLAINKHTVGAAYTYNEPIIWYEFLLDCMKEFRKTGLKNVLVSNGCINSEPLNELIPFIDAVNIDLKGFTEDFYKWVNGDFNLVQQTAEMLHKNNIHLEMTNLVIPTKNDDQKKFTEMCRWIASMSPDIVLHISRYFPTYKCNISPTDSKTIEDLYKTAKKYLNFVYPGNIALNPEYNNTYCKHCSSVLINRSGYVAKSYIRDKKCPECREVTDYVVTS